MCVTQLNRIEIKGNYRAPVHSCLHLTIRNLLFRALLTLTKARQPVAGRGGTIANNERQRLAAADAQSQRAGDGPCRSHLQMNSPEPNLSWSESHGCREVSPKKQKGAHLIGRISPFHHNIVRSRLTRASIKLANWVHFIKVNHNSRLLLLAGTKPISGRHLSVLRRTW